MSRITMLALAALLALTLSLAVGAADDDDEVAA